MAMYCVICSEISVVGIAIRYGLDGPGIESRWCRDFPHPFRPALRPTHPSIEWGTGSFPGVKRPGRGFDHPPPSNAEVKEIGDFTSTPFLDLDGMF